MARWRLLVICQLAATTVVASLLALLAAPGITAAGVETLRLCREQALTIPDGGPAGVTDTLLVSSDMIVVEARVAMTLTHDWAGDLVVTLNRGEEGVEMTLLDRFGVSAELPDGCGAALQAVQFADGGAAVDDCVPTLTGTIRPVLPLAMAAGQPVSAAWHLHVTDAASGMAGTLDGWCLQATVSEAPSLRVTPATVHSWVAPGLTRTVEVTLANGGNADWRWGEAPVVMGGKRLLTEGFEGGTMPPPGWERQTQLATATWQVFPGTGHRGANAAAVTGASSEQDEWLISPPLWLQQGWLAHWTWGSASACREQNLCDLEVWLLAESGDATLLGKADDAWPEEGAWTAHAWDLTAHLPATGAVRVAFRYASSGDSAEARLDDVMVTGLVRPEGCREPAPAWMQLVPLAGALAPGEEAPLSIVLDATALLAGTYTGSACVPGNDPQAPLWPLPVTVRADSCVEQIPAEPALSITRGDGGEAVLSWEAQPGGITYLVERGLDPYAELPWLALAAGSSAATDPAPGTAAFYRLVASNCSGEQTAASNRAGWLVASLAGSDGELARWSSVGMAVGPTSTLDTATELAATIPGTEQLLRWAPEIQNFAYFAPPEMGSNFAIETGVPVFILRSGTAFGFTLSGDVPAPGDVSFEMLGGTPCRWNHLSLPLEQGVVTTAQALAEAIRGDESTAVEQVLVWNAAEQAFAYWIPSPVGGNTGMGTNFATRIGGDYFVCLNRDVSWP